MINNFKGTAGPWSLELSGKKGAWIGNEKGYAALSCGNTDEQAHANGVAIAHLPEMMEALQEFCDRVDRGEVRSTKTYNKFKDILRRATNTK